MSDPLVTAARERLLKFKGDYPCFCERTGLDYSWVSKFSRGVRGKRVGLDQFQKLLNALDLVEQQEPTDPNPPVRRTPAAQGATAETTEPVLTGHGTTTSMN